jgi:hypothetical protein
MSIIKKRIDIHVEKIANGPTHMKHRIEIIIGTNEFLVLRSGIVVSSKCAGSGMAGEWTWTSRDEMGWRCLCGLPGWPGGPVTHRAPV